MGPEGGGASRRLCMNGYGVTMAGDVATLPRYFLRAMRWVEYKKVLAVPMVSCRFTLDQAKEGFEAFPSRGDGQSTL
jgi:threonine dehydrogenase-like Zn-dependent dehydrogenase